jgi:hypothetical protein
MGNPKQSELHAAHYSKMQTNLSNSCSYMSRKIITSVTHICYSFNAELDFLPP